MENESQETLRHSLIQLREELVEIKMLIHEARLDATALIKECKKGFKTISETGNTRVADVFLEELNKELNDL